MKNYLTFILVTIVSVSTGYGQLSPETVVSSFNVPVNWASKFTRDSSFFPLFERKQIANWTFKNNLDSTIGIKFYVFNYTSKDSVFFNKRIGKYTTLSSCLLTASDKQNENFASFYRDNYFFLMKMCPCNTRENKECRELAKQLFEWIRQPEAKY